MHSAAFYPQQLVDQVFFYYSIITSDAKLEAEHTASNHQNLMLQRKRTQKEKKKFGTGIMEVVKAFVFVS